VTTNFPRLRVVVDGAYRLEAQGTGISTYSRTLGRALASLGHQVSWLSGAHAPRQSDSLVDSASAADRQPEPTGLRRKLQTAKRMAAGVAQATATGRLLTDAARILAPTGTLPSEPVILAPDLFEHAHYRHMLLRQFTEVRVPETPDVLHLTAPLPLTMRGVKIITTIHDLVPIRLPYASPDNKTEFIHRVRACAAQSDLILTVSEASKADIVEILQVDPAKVAVTYQPAELEPLDADAQAVLPRTLARFGLKAEEYALFVGAIEPKKNLRRLIVAFLDADTDLPLVITGRKAWMWEQEIGDLETAFGEAACKRVIFPGYVSPSDLSALYAGSRLFLFPSLLEGFGLPALEALKFGRPVIASRTGSLPEVCGDAALYVDPFDTADIRRAIERVLGDDALRSQLGAAGPLQAATFSADAYVQRLGEAYGRFG
jgi:glycosyltransferase involved in cell wall biosynthesis